MTNFNFDTYFARAREAGAGPEAAGIFAAVACLVADAEAARAARREAARRRAEDEAEAIRETIEILG